MEMKNLTLEGQLNIMRSLTTSKKLQGKKSIMLRTHNIHSTSSSCSYTSSSPHLHRCERHEALRVRRQVRVAPPEGPPRLPPNARHRLHGVEEVRLFCGILDVRVDQQAVHLAVDVLDRDLEAVEAPRLRQLDLAAEVARQVL